MSQPINSYFNQGLLHLEDGEYELAVERLTQAMRLSLGDLAEVALYRGIAYAFLQANDRAMADFNEAIRRNPNLVDAYNERGNLLRLQGQYQAAIDDYNIALQLDDTHDAAYYHRGLAHEALDQYSEAEQDLTAALAINPGIASAYEVRGRIRALKKNYDGAILDLQRYLHMGGGREFDNHSEVQSFILNLRLNRFLSRFIPKQFIPGNRI